MFTCFGEREQANVSQWIGRALRGRLIQIPAASGSINWKLPSTFLEKSNLEPTAEDRGMAAQNYSYI
jgi:hypothetical protein